MSILNRVRGAVGVTVTWTLAWAIFGVLFRLIWPYEYTGMPSLYMLASSAVAWLVPGVIAGLSFSLFLTAQSKRRLEEISPLRMGVLGLAGGIAFPLFVAAGWLVTSDRSLGWLLQPLAQWAVAGTVSAIGSLALAKRALSLSNALEAESGTSIAEPQGDARSLPRR